MRAAFVEDFTRRNELGAASSMNTAGALELYGPQYGLPPVIGGANSLWERGYGDPAPETVIVVGLESQATQRYFEVCWPAGVVANRYQVKNEETLRHSAIFIRRQPRQPWAEMWPTM